MWSGLIGQWPSKNVAKIRQALRLKCKVSSFPLHVKFTCFNFLTKIFGLFSSNHWITTREQLSPQHFQRVGSYGQFLSWWTDSPKSPCNSTEPLDLIYVFWYLLCVLWIVRISNLSTLNEVRISNFKYIYGVMRSEKLVRKLKVRIWMSM
jgi:hypothetical protein